MRDRRPSSILNDSFVIDDMMGDYNDDEAGNFGRDRDRDGGGSRDGGGGGDDDDDYESERKRSRRRRNASRRPLAVRPVEPIQLVAVANALPAPRSGMPRSGPPATDIAVEFSTTYNGATYVMLNLLDAGLVQPGANVIHFDMGGMRQYADLHGDGCLTIRGCKEVFTSIARFTMFCKTRLKAGRKKLGRTTDEGWAQCYYKGRRLQDLRALLSIRLQRAHANLLLYKKHYAAHPGAPEPPEVTSYNAVATAPQRGEALQLYQERVAGVLKAEAQAQSVHPIVAKVMQDATRQADVLHAQKEMADRLEAGNGEVQQARAETADGGGRA